ncbi:nucleoporin Nup35 [Euwallacea similis]|uniref:nucleoporin Nup35 n=1 Tax=Euwallacea similis TaxID=1736056 RepID=UPI00344B5367
MEPMTLGSAPSSPQTPGTNPNFLPSFLIGDIPPSTPYNPTVSPGRNKTPVGFRSSSSINESRSLRQKLFNQSGSSESPAPVTSPFVPIGEKAGPPKTGLFDTLDSAKKMTTTPILSSTVAYPNEVGLFNENFSRIHPEEGFIPSRSFNSSSRLEQVDTNWITVFGFPPSCLNSVISQLSNCGVITDRLIPPQGNWIHVKFNNFSEVNRALSLHGKCINNNIMIGIQLYYPKENKENSSAIASSARARSLRHSFISPHTSNTVLPVQNVPQKSTGIVSKAMEYVFGW